MVRPGTAVAAAPSMVADWKANWREVAAASPVLTSVSDAVRVPETTALPSEVNVGAS